MKRPAIVSFPIIVIMITTVIIQILLENNYADSLFIVYAFDTSKKLNFLTVKNPSLGIALNYPSDWSKSETGNDISFRSPDGYAEFAILVASNNRSLNELVSQGIKVLNIHDTDIHLILSTPVTIVDSKSAHLIAYSFIGTDPDIGAIKAMTISALKDEKVYVLTYTAKAAAYDIYIPTIQKMISSFKII